MRMFFLNRMKMHVSIFTITTKLHAVYGGRGSPPPPPRIAMVVQCLLRGCLTCLYVPEWADIGNAGNISQKSVQHGFRRRLDLGASRLTKILPTRHTHSDHLAV